MENEKLQEALEEIMKALLVKLEATENEDEGALIFATQSGLKQIFNLNIYETKVWLALLKKGIASAGEIAEISASQGQHFIDAPVSGGQAGAENGVLTVMAGGEADIFVKTQPVMAAYARFSQLMGAVGSGQLAKMVNQICIAGLVQGLSEGINFGMKAGLNMEDVIEVISKGAAQSWQMENRYKTMIEDKFDFGFAVDWMRKDLGIALNEARQNGSHLPLTALVDQFYSEVQQMGGGRWDTSSLLARLKR